MSDLGSAGVEKMDEMRQDALATFYQPAAQCMMGRLHSK
jgi:hypothetical protein